MTPEERVRQQLMAARAKRIHEGIERQLFNQLNDEVKAINARLSYEQAHKAAADFEWGTKMAKPHTFGWLRRPDMDIDIGNTQIEMWEKPNGSFYEHRKECGPLMLPVVPRARVQQKP